MTDVEIDELITALETAREGSINDDPTAMTVRQ